MLQLVVPRAQGPAGPVPPDLCSLSASFAFFPPLPFPSGRQFRARRLRRRAYLPFSSSPFFFAFRFLFLFLLCFSFEWPGRRAAPSALPSPLLSFLFSPFLLFWASASSAPFSSSRANCKPMPRGILMGFIDEHDRECRKMTFSQRFYMRDTHSAILLDEQPRQLGMALGCDLNRHKRRRLWWAKG